MPSKGKDTQKEQEKEEEKEERQEEKEEHREEDKENEDDQGQGQGDKSHKEGENDDGDGKKNQKDYFKTELKRLKNSLEKEASKIQAPEQYEHTPYIFNTLEPYYNTSTPRYLIEMPDQVRHGYVSRQTAIKLCDPWVDHQMDVTLLPKIEPKVVRPEEDKKKKKEKSKDKPEGSTRLPKFPAVHMPTDDITKNKTIYYSDVPHIREELRKRYGANSDTKVQTDYNRTKQDFYRMELDRMDEYHPSSRPRMRSIYLAYLQNNPGSKKAVRECVKKVDEDSKEGDKNQKQQQQAAA